MAGPYWKYPGVLEGRIQPSQVTPEDGSYVFCLGEDVENFGDHMLTLNDEISVEQSIDLTNEDLLRFRWNLRTGDMPPPRVLVSGGTVEFKETDLVAQFQDSDSVPLGADGLQGVDLGIAGFLPQDRDRWCRVAGTTTNDGDFRVSAVPVTQARYIVASGSPAIFTISPAGRLAVLDGDITNQTPTNATVTMLGLRWRIKLEVGGTEIFDFATVPNQQALWRTTLAANVSKLTGSQAVKFIIALEQYE
jgi:hypothetical protein